MELVIDGIPVEVNRKKIKNMYLYVKPPAGAVTVSAPMRMPRQNIERFVRELARLIVGDKLLIVLPTEGHLQPEPRVCRGSPVAHGVPVGYDEPVKPKLLF